VGDMVRAAVQTGPRQIELREFPRPVIGPQDGGLLRVEACGICGSDVEQYKGHLSSQWLPMVPGHEPLGIIEEVSSLAAARWGVEPGDRVAVEILIPCRSCDLCLAGRYMSCRHRIGSHGGSNPPERGLGLWGGVDVALDLTPMAAQPVRDALSAVRWGGRVVLAGLKGRQPVSLSTDLIINRALTVVGAFSVDSRGYAEAIRLIETGRFPLERMHTHTFGLDDIGRAIETLAGEVPGEDAVHVAIVPGA